MNILIDTSPLGDLNATRGVGRYTQELVSALRTLQSTHSFFTTQDQLPHIDIIHYPFFDLFLPSLPLLSKTKTVVTIHDVTPLVFPKLYPRGIRGELALLRQKVALRHVRHVITDSQCAKHDITEYLGVAANNITPIPLAASDIFMKLPTTSVEEVRKRYGVPKNYCLYVGDINANKNLPFLIRVMAHIPDVSLVLVGAAMRNISIPEGRDIQQAIAAAGNEKYVKLLDSVASQADLVALYNGARVYVQPSLYEGFGLPVIEAMRCKVPVVSSCGGSLAEVVGDAGLQFNPRDPKACESAIRKVLRLDPHEHALMVKKAYDYSEGFTWERTARETLAVYEKIVKN